MMIWNEPSEKNPYLVLPCLPNSGTISQEPILTLVPEIKINACPSLISTWQNPVSDTQNPVVLNEKLHILGKSFNELVRIGRGRVSYQTKTHASDFVTDMDRGIEALMRLWLNKHYPHHKIIGEEGKKEQTDPKDYVWFLDPIDGTGNFVQGSDDVAIHLGCLHQGLPFATFFGLPFYDQGYTLYSESPPIHPASKFVLGTEYLPQKNREAAEYRALLMQLSAQEHRVKSIGIHLYQMMQGKVSAFFKPGVKLWDVIAPCSLMHHYAKPYFNIEIVYQNRCLPLFNDDPDYWKYINQQKDYRAGFLMITRPDDPDLREVLKSKA